MAEHVCPVWMGYFMANPSRKLFQNPHKILAPYLSRGKRVLEVGPGMGFFSLPMAEMVKPSGKVYCVDIQKGMLTKLEKRAEKKNLKEYIETIECTSDSLNVDSLKGQIDFALIFAVLHEVPDQENFLKQIYNSLTPGGVVLLSEPSGHISTNEFEKSVSLAEKTGFKLEDYPKIFGSHSIIMTKNNHSG